MYANKFKTKENKISTEDKNKLNHNLNNKKKYCCVLQYTQSVQLWYKPRFTLIYGMFTLFLSCLKGTGNTANN